VQHPEKAQSAMRKFFCFLQVKQRQISQNNENLKWEHVSDQKMGINVQSDGLTDQESEAYDQLVKLDRSVYERERSEFSGGKMRRECISSWGVKDLYQLTFGRAEFQVMCLQILINTHLFKARRDN